MRSKSVRKIFVFSISLFSSIKSTQMIDERRALVRSLSEQFFGDGSNHFLCARILLEQIKLDLASGNSLDMYENSFLIISNSFFFLLK